MDRTVLSFPLTNNWRRTKRWPRLLYAPTAINRNRECTPWIAERATSFVLLRGTELVWFLHRSLHHGWSFIASSQCFLCRQCRSRSAIRSHFIFFIFDICCLHDKLPFRFDFQTFRPWLLVSVKQSNVEMTCTLLEITMFMSDCWKMETTFKVVLSQGWKNVNSVQQSKFVKAFVFHTFADR